MRKRSPGMVVTGGRAAGAAGAKCRAQRRAAFSCAESGNGMERIGNGLNS